MVGLLSKVTLKHRLISKYTVLITFEIHLLVWSIGTVHITY
jgi:hypothetical protein